MIAELRLKSLRLCKSVNLEVDPSSAIWPVTDPPFGLQTVDGREHTSHIFQQVRSGLLSNIRVNRDKNVVNGISFVPSGDTNWNKKRRLLPIVFPK